MLYYIIYLKLKKESHNYLGVLMQNLQYYTLAKHEVNRWLDIVQQEGLLRLIDDIKKGEDFYAVYNRIEFDIKK